MGSVARSLHRRQAIVQQPGLPQWATLSQGTFLADETLGVLLSKGEERNLEENSARIGSLAVPNPLRLLCPYSALSLTHNRPESLK